MKLVFSTSKSNKSAFLSVSGIKKKKLFCMGELASYEPTGNLKDTIILELSQIEECPAHRKLSPSVPIMGYICKLINDSKRQKMREYSSRI